MDATAAADDGVDAVTTVSGEGSMADVVVVGAGVAGALVAYDLARSGLNVHVLEAGGRIDRTEAVERFRRAVRRDEHAPFPQWRHAPVPREHSAPPYLQQSGPDKFRSTYVRAVGGATWHWTAITPRFLTNDFAMRSRYGVGRDWPIGYDELEPYYLKAEWALGVAGDSDDDQGSPRSGPYPMPPFALPYGEQVMARRLAPHGYRVSVMPVARNSRDYDGRSACCGSNSCTPICPTGAQYSANVHVSKAERAGARLTDHAVVDALDQGPDRRITRVRYRDPSGGRHAVACRYVVLAANALETPKLLLMSRSEASPDGVANFSGQVGRNLMTHPALGVEFLMPEPIFAGRGPMVVGGLNHRRDGGFRSRHAGARMTIHNHVDPQPFISRLIEKGLDWAHLRARLRHYVAHGSFITAEFEQLPNPDNRVGLSGTAHDALGLPRMEVDFDYGEYERRTALILRRHLHELLAHLGARPILDMGIDEVNANHILGTTRMGTDPRDSVTDPYGRVHDVPNLYIAGGGLFPSGGTANPTLTVAALCLRLADRLKAQVSEEPG